MEIVHQLGQLFLAAVPTVVLVFLFYFFMRWSFFTPIKRVMDERHARIEGARRATDAAHKAAQEKLGAYRTAIKNANAQLFTEQDAARRQAVEKREAGVRTAREAEQERVRLAKARQAEEFNAAREALRGPSVALGRQIAQSFLAPRTPQAGSTGGAGATGQL